MPGCRVADEIFIHRLYKILAYSPASHTSRCYGSRFYSLFQAGTLTALGVAGRLCILRYALRMSKNKGNARGRAENRYGGRPLRVMPS
jgi:hypothetical protein